MTKQSQDKESVERLSLIGKVCLLEGSSKAKINTYITVLKALGATISQSFGDHLTHYIVVSQQPHHLYPKRLLAAQLLDIKTVQVAWVDRCKELNQYVSEIGYEIPIPLAFIESYLRKARNITSFNLSDIKATSDAIGLPIYDEDEELKTTTTNQMTRGNTSSAAVIPLPTFRKFVPPVIPPNAAITMVKRRSERISDLNSDDGHYLDDLFDYKTVTSDIEGNNTNNNKMQELSLELVLNIPVDLPLSVLYEDGRIGSSEDECVVNDTTVMNDLTHHVKQYTSTASTAINNTTNKTSNASNSNKRKVDVAAINDSNNNSKRSCRSNTTTSNTTIDTTTSDVPAIISSANQFVVAVSRSKSKVVDSMKDTSSKIQPQQLPLFVSAGLWKATMVIALTGFNDKNGEKSTITSTLKQLIKTIKKKATNNSKPNFVPNINNNSSSRNNKNKIPVINPLETSVMMVADSEDFSTCSCNIVIAGKKSQTRSLRILFALANGLLIVTEEWVYQSVSQEAWADPHLYPHPRFGDSNSQRIHPSILTNPEAIHTFKNNKICVLNSTDPSLDVLISLVHSSGGSTTKDMTLSVDCDISYVLFGDQTDANTWVANIMKNCLHAEESIECLKDFSKCNKIVTRKFLFNCIEARKIHQPTSKDGELISLESLLATYYDVNNNKDCGNNLRSVKTKPGRGSRTMKLSNATDRHLATSQTHAGNNNSRSSYSKRCKDTMHSLESQTKHQLGHNGNVSHMLEKKGRSLAGVTPHDWVKTNHHTAHLLDNEGEDYDPSPIAALHTASPIDLQLTGYTTTAALAEKVDLSSSTITEKLVVVANTLSGSDEEEEEEETTLLDGSVLLNDMASVNRTTNTQLAASSLLSLLSTSKQQQQQQQYINTLKPATATSHTIPASNIKSVDRNNTTTAINKSRSESTNQTSKHHVTTTNTTSIPVIVSDFIDPYASYTNNNTKDNKKNISTTNDKKKHNDEVEHVRKASISSILKQKQGSNIILYDHNTKSDDETNDRLLDVSKYNKLITTTNVNATSSITKQTTNKALTSNLLHVNIPNSSNSNPTLHTAAVVVNQNSSGRSSGRLIKNKKSISSSLLKSINANNDNNRDKDSDDEIQFTPSQVTPVAIATGRVPRSEGY